MGPSGAGDIEGTPPMTDALKRAAGLIVGICLVPVFLWKQWTSGRRMQ